MAEGAPTIQDIGQVRIADWLETLPGQVRIEAGVFDLGDLIDLSEDQCIVRLKLNHAFNGHAPQHPFTLFLLAPSRLDLMPLQIRRRLGKMPPAPEPTPGPGGREVPSRLPGAVAPVPTPALEPVDSAPASNAAPKFPAPAAVATAAAVADAGVGGAPRAEEPLDTGTGAETREDPALRAGAPHATAGAAGIASTSDASSISTGATGPGATGGTTRAATRGRPVASCNVLQEPASAGAAAGEVSYLLFDDQPGIEWQSWFEQQLASAGLSAVREDLKPAEIPTFLRIVGQAMNYLFDAYDCLARDGVVWQNIGPLFLIADEAVEGGYRLETTGLRRFRPAPGAGYPERSWHRLYAAPEAHNGQGLTPKSDVFTAGVALYALLTGVDLRRWEICGEAQMLPTVRTFWRGCPAGVAPVLQELLRHEEAYRPGLAEARARVARALDTAAHERLYRGEAFPAEAGFGASGRGGPVRSFETSVMTLNGWVKELRAQQSRQGMVFSRPNQDAAFLSDRIDGVRMLGEGGGHGAAGGAEGAPVALAVVADGISTCRFGRGELASEAVVTAFAEVWRLWLEGLRANRWSWESDPAAVFGQSFLTRWSLERDAEAGAGRFMRRFSFPHLAAECIRRATLRIWSQVVEEVRRMPSADPAEIMGSTMIAAFVHGSRVMLANLGDSRAYLVSPAADPEQVWTIESLTCDHDEKHRLFREEQAMPQHMLGLSGLESLTNGIGSLVAPARSGLGLVGRGSRGGLRGVHAGDPGGGVENGANVCTVWRPAYHRLAPDFYTLRVHPQDVLILCSDGLIDERAALMPEEAAQIVTEYQDAPADHLAMQLVKAANDIQEWPSKGDNITAVVLKFHA
ncbi:MAG: hypothetical protein ACREJ2_16930 [Planctomycetota bacterium]